MKKSSQVAVGGLCAALCVVLMFMTGLIPFSSYVFPAMAGIVLIAVCVENGTKTGILVYAATSVLALLVVPDRQTVLLFILLLGYYPMLKPRLERLPRIVSLLLKLILVNGAVVLFYHICLYILGIPDLLDGWGNLGRYTIYVVFAMVNFTFFMYDFLIDQVSYLYTHWIRPKILRKSN